MEMTREEAKGNLIHAIRWNDMPKKEALDVAIKALEQESVLDKIIAVVKRGRKEGTNWSDIRLMDIEDIVDKSTRQKAKCKESEEKIEELGVRE